MSFIHAHGPSSGCCAGCAPHTVQMTRLAARLSAVPCRLHAIAKSSERQGETAGPSAPQPKIYESDNLWDYKPAWCQPLTILGTGSAFVCAANQLSHHSLLVTGLTAVPVAFWWLVFLVLVPGKFKEYVRSQKAQKRTLDSGEVFK